MVAVQGPPRPRPRVRTRHRRVAVPELWARATAAVLLTLAHTGPITPAVLPARHHLAAPTQAPKRDPHRGPSRDRTLHSKARRRARHHP